jgi:hypothetical protein
MKRAGITVGPLDAYIRSLHNGERFYAQWVANYIEDPQKMGDWNGPGTAPPVYPARWSQEHAREIAGTVYRLYGEEDGWRAERRLEGQRQLSAIVSEAAKRDASERRLEAALRTGHNRSRHNVTIKHTSNYRFSAGQKSYIAQCTCGWEGTPRSVERGAADEKKRHLAQAMTNGQNRRRGFTLNQRSTRSRYRRR